jgi:hypothetical protein
MYLHTESPNTCLTNVVKYRENTIRRSDIKPLTQCAETLQMLVQVFVTLHISQNLSSTSPPSPQHNCAHSTAPVPDPTATGIRQYHDCPLKMAHPHSFFRTVDRAYLDAAFSAKRTGHAGAYCHQHCQNLTLFAFTDS